ncbi:hypothetical protein S-PM2d216 [Synechococcus phage S-PM2]|uniref:Hypothetical-Protein / belonging to T4-LIKE GC: 733 n=1 Tax=Synechococcus phage S-PM2 TaxID=238854 RepID=Q5GQC1_BPSYP|nr:Hypothetical-Protein / belonging to T4-LIKE GC: 733 [Synechococcus phage S-PM2]CAF34281.1 Hypothetical-Protein / belonging to T4-LIKE GC: 733 [Synechococcus phage S-PM2]CFW42450.1 hypothetical protein S-PM2d216 [Synechococcus phage S-PM2]
MSLLSQRDREITISALENYIMMLRSEATSDNPLVVEANTLLNWIKIEYQKNN